MMMTMMISRTMGGGALLLIYVDDNIFDILYKVYDCMLKASLKILVACFVCLYLLVSLVC